MCRQNLLELPMQDFLQLGCPLCRPSSSVRALKHRAMIVETRQHKAAAKKKRTTMKTAISQK